MNLVTFLEYLLLAAGVMGILFVVGYPITYVARRTWGGLWFVPAPVAGMALIQMAVWYWFVLGNDGVAPPAVALTVVGGVLTAFLLVQGFRSGDRPRPDHVRLLAGSAVAAIFVCATNYYYLLTLPGPTSASVGNNDIAAYAMTSGHMRTLGFGDYGAIIGDNIGHTARTNAFGSSALISAVSSVLGLQAGRVLMVVIFVLLGLMLFGLAKMVIELRPAGQTVAVLAATGASTSVLFIYTVSNYYIGQVMAMAMIPFVVIGSLRAAEKRSRRDRVGLALSFTIPFMVVLSHYIHMAFLAPLVVVPPAVFATTGPGPKELVRRIVRVGGTAATGLLVGILLVPQWVTEGVAQLRQYANAVAGWELTDYWPVEVMGFMRGVTPVTTQARWVWSAVIVVVFLASIVLLWRSSRPLAAFGLGLTTLVALSYIASIHRYGGGSYRQWKWITFFEPIVAAVVLAVVAAAIARLAGRWPAHGRFGERIAVAVTALLVLAIWSNPGSDPRPPGVSSLVAMRSKTAAVVEEADFGLSSFSAVQQSKSLNVDLGPYWHSMWAAAMLPDKTLALLSPSYFARSEAVAPDSLVATTPDIDYPGATRLGDQFLLVPPYAGPLSNDPASLGSSLSARYRSKGAGVGGTMELEAVNTGTGAWITAAGQTGTVAIGGQLRDSSGKIVNPAWLYRPVVDPRVSTPLPPGSRVRMSIDVPAVPAPGMSVEMRLVSEQLTGFGESIEVDLPPPA